MQTQQGEDSGYLTHGLWTGTQLGFAVHLACKWHCFAVASKGVPAVYEVQRKARKWTSHLTVFAAGSAKASGGRGCSMRSGGMGAAALPSWR